MLNSWKYVETVVHGEKLNADFGGVYRLVSQRPYKGKPEAGLAAGITACLMVLEDHSEPTIDKATGKPKDNNVFETFEVTIPGLAYPAPFAKGDYVALDGFMPEASFSIDHNLILRFKTLRAASAPKSQGQGGKD